MLDNLITLFVVAFVLFIGIMILTRKPKGEDIRIAKQAFTESPRIHTDYFGQGDVPAGYMDRTQLDKEIEFRILYAKALEAQEYFHLHPHEHSYNGYRFNTIDSLVRQYQAEHTAKFGYVDDNLKTLPVQHTPDMPDKIARGLRGFYYPDQRTYDIENEKEIK